MHDSRLRPIEGDRHEVQESVFEQLAGDHGYWWVDRHCHARLRPGRSAPAGARGRRAASGEGEAIVVTGSRIPTPNLSGTSPVTVINSAEVHLQGTTRTEDLINSLPQAFAGQGGNLANGATGTATVDLRDLGPRAPWC